MKKTFIKITSALTACCMLFGSAALAAPVTSGGDGTEYGYYWRQDFNDLPEDASSTTAVRRSGISTARYTVKDNDYALKLVGTGGTPIALIDGDAAGNVDKPLPKFDFSKGAVILSYDVIIPSDVTSNPTTYLSLRSDALTNQYQGGNDDLLRLARFENGNIKGYEKASGVTAEYCRTAADLTAVNSAVTYAAGTTHTIQAALIYDEENKAVTVLQYVDGKPLMSQDQTRQLKYQFQYTDSSKMPQIVNDEMFFRFTVAKGSTVVIDNITLRSESDINMSNVSYIEANAAKAAVTVEDTAAFDPSASVSSYPKSVNSIPLNTTLEGDNDYYTLTKYDTSNPLLLKAGTPASSKVVWKSGDGMTVSELDIANDNEF